MKTKDNKYTLVFRLMHKDNLQLLLEAEGICASAHEFARCNSGRYVQIGAADVIQKRAQKMMPIGSDVSKPLNEYVPFYFAHKSLMLYNIITGTNVARCDRKDLVLLVAYAEELAAANPAIGHIITTNGNAAAEITIFKLGYQQVESFVSFDLIDSGNFASDARDVDKKRRYNAEFLVYRFVPLSFVRHILVCGKEVLNELRAQYADTPLAERFAQKPEFFFLNDSQRIG
jgi:hypothetical protein